MAMGTRHPVFLLLLLLSVVMTPRHLTRARTYKLGMMNPYKHIRLGWDVTASAASMALQRVKDDGILPNDDISLIYADDQCNAKVGAGMSVVLRDDYDIDGFIGPPCSTSTKAAGLLASYWNLPMFTQGSTDPLLSDKTTFNTLVRMAPNFSKMGAAVAEVCKKFGWHRIVLMSNIKANLQTDIFCDYASRSVEEVFRHSNLTLTDWVKFPNYPSAGEIDDLLDRVSTRGRVVILCSSVPDEHHILRRAHLKGMTNGDYVYITMDHIPPPEVVTPWVSDDHPDDLLDLYRSVIQVTVASLIGPKIDAFRELVPYKMMESPWNYNGTVEEGKLGSSYSPFMHDIVYLYALALNKTLSEDGNPRNGTLMFENAKTQTFEGISGAVMLDDNADRHPNFWLWHMNPDIQAFDVWTEIKMVAPESEERIVIDKPARWGTSDNTPPLDVPECGFFNELCPESKSNQDVIIAAVLSVVIIMMAATVGGGFYYRKKKMEEELNSMLWRVKYEDITFVKSSRSCGSIMSHPTYRSMASMVTSGNTSTGLAGGDGVTINDVNARNVAYFKGALVSVRHIEVKSLTLTRPDLLELNCMRQLTNENLNSFLGACIDFPNVCMLSTFCARGSLQDVLENDEIKLDWLFRMSLLTDLANGLHYLQTTSLKSHGNLTSDNCLIDNRWVLKVCNFGMLSLRRQCKRSISAGEHEKYRDMLWTAPELLRVPIESRPRNGTQEGDVYSFGIIAQEIVHREMPFLADNGLEPKEIVERVIKCEQPAFRPEVSSKETCSEMPAEMITLMKQCWDENPLLRPSLNHINRTLRSFNKGKKLNIMDNMLNMMEKYANNLEEIVEQRTSELVDEKKKTDTLLYRMLPRSIAEELKKGKVIQAEIFDFVTVFFSDIVGFTKLSSESSPVEIVDFLNDLYTQFDDIITKHDVYKVETIGDAYMVVSGLPQRNGNRHCAEIANTSLDLLHTVHCDFKIRHKPDQKLRLRIGLHTGPCAAGVVGLTMPRYCLFGDTVNMASRMESNGEALKIHMSQDAHAALLKIGGYHMVKRGQMEIKGKGSQTTYWLRGRTGYTKELPEWD